MRTFFLFLSLLTITFYSFESFAYYPITPYSYCAGNPVNFTDPSGKDIVVLKGGKKIGPQHMAILIQNENGKWQYYSINGNNKQIPILNIEIGLPSNDVAVGSWDSPQEFFNSPYNAEEGNGRKYPEVNAYDYSEGYQIPTSPEQDAIMRESFTETAKTEYNILSNNCATAVQEAMTKAGIPVSEPKATPITAPTSTQIGLVNVAIGYKIEYKISIYPIVAFKSIVESNPNGEHIQK